MTLPTNRQQSASTTRRNDAPILSAALNSFAERGFNGAAMREIAQEAGTSLSNLYNYYPSKQALLHQVLSTSNQELLHCLRAAVDKPRLTPAERLAAAVRAHVGFVIDHQQLSRVALTEIRYLTGSLRSDVVAARDGADAVFRIIIEDGRADGTFRTPYPEGAARAILSMNSVICTWYHQDGPLTGAEIAEAQSRYALGLVEATVHPR